MVGLGKVQGKFKGPFKIVRTTPHNTVFVDIDGSETRFNVSQIEAAATPAPLNRSPPSYKDGSVGNTEIQNKIQTRVNAIVGEEAPEEAPPQQKQNPQPQPLQKKVTTTTTLKGKKRAKSYTLVLDSSVAQYYAGEIIEDGQVHLLKRAKGRKYHPLWYSTNDLNDPPKSKATPSRPKGYEKWLVTPDEVWKLIPPTVSKISQLQHKLIN